MLGMNSIQLENAYQHGILLHTAITKLILQIS